MVSLSESNSRWELTVPGLLRPYDIVQTAPGTLVAEFFFTSEHATAHRGVMLILVQLPCSPLVHCSCPPTQSGTLRKPGCALAVQS